MNAKQVLIVISFFLLKNNLLQAQEKGVRFKDNLSWNQVLAEARASNKYVFVDCYASWCGPCKAMDNNVYTAETVGDFMNDKFVSVKIQMDRTSKDNENVRMYYEVASQLESAYNIGAYPSFLFFSPSGEIVHRGLGYKDGVALIALAKESMDTSKQYYARVRAFFRGGMGYPEILSLSEAANAFGSKVFSDSLANLYEKGYLDNLREKEYISKATLNFYSRHNRILDSHDKFFKIAYQHPERFDSFRNGISAQLVKNVITRENIDFKLWKNGQPLTNNPNWKEIKTSIARKYDKSFATSTVLESQLAFYKKIGDWFKYVKYREEMISMKKLVPGGGFGGDAWKLNADSWDVFIGCTDRKILKKSLRWINMAIPVAEAGNEDLNAYYDTKANIMYKLGMKDEAIVNERKAIELSKDEAERNLFIKTLSQMEKGQPTYDAKWVNN